MSPRRPPLVTEPGPCETPGLDAVFVDLDNTLVKGCALFRLGGGLAASGIVDRSAIVRLTATHALFKLLGEHPRLLTTARRRGLELVTGLPADQILDNLEALCQRYVMPHLWPGTLHLIAGHQQRGTPVWLATAAPVGLALAIAELLGLAGALGTQVECRDGVFTGRLAGPMLHGPAKEEAVSALSASRGWDLDRCAAYSDSAADLPLLMTVGHAAVINPDRVLRRIAREHSWPVHDFRTRRLVVGGSGHGDDATGPAAPAKARRRSSCRLPGAVVS